MRECDKNLKSLKTKERAKNYKKSYPHLIVTLAGFFKKSYLLIIYC